jgi:hypothetical protein
MTEIKVTLQHMYNGPQSRVPFVNYYSCDGPDGRHFTNSCKATLKSVLTRRYGKVTLKVNDLRKPINEY